ncbi:MAG: adenylate/guanylate cyclase domain-containing protein [Anaerolineae bacterium]
MKLTLAERLSASLYEPGDGLYEDRALMPYMVATMLVGAPMMLAWAFVFYHFFSESGAALGFAGYAAVDVALLAVLSVRRLRATHVRDFYLGVHLAANFAIVASLGGIGNSTGVIFFALIAPFSMVTQPTRQFLKWLGITLGLSVLVVALQPWLPSSNNVPHSISAVFWGVNLVNFSIILYWNLRALLRQRDTALEMLKVEQLKSENLLLNILPSEIAQALKNEKRTIADQIEQASVLFADVVNFTPMSASMTATELVELLNEVYSHFDALVEKYDLEKIKTIGDCYMVAAGVPRRRPDHACVITELALDIRDYVSQHEFRGRQLQFRIGINSGSVVAGVIGKKKFAYDLWGDTVNTASRMESHGSGGFIQITEETYNLVKNDFRCEPRGKVNVKGKGEINVWYVMDRAA